ncbi:MULTISPECIES: mannose-1-phosphate guanylyltransferase [unclassified Luteococcus]|uniref:mannose-1-phosphate guanylyltransferase n=1 Tax=unclassified Luteococcus TaxID=2639923 RepID=UPI00313CDDFB
MRHVVIMAGGSGTRLWPLSRKGEPKQLLELIDGKSLLRLAYERVAGTVPDANILVCCGAAYTDVVARQLPELPEDNLLGEPVGRDSLNAVAWPAAVLQARDAEAVVAVLTADQIITPVAEFTRALDQAFQIAEADASALVTFGVVPDSPHTGYGYLKRGEPVAGFPQASQIVEFKEKPTLEVAEQYLASGDYWWNSGMFVWRAATVLEQLRILEPATHGGVLELAEHPDRLDQIYPELKKTSVDYAVMEPVSQGRGSGHVVAVPLEIEWYDLGGYAALAEQLAHDEHGNAREGVTVALDSSNNLLINRGRPGTVVAVAGLSGMVVCVTEQATLVVPLADSQRVKEVVALVADQVGPELA